MAVRVSKSKYEAFKKYLEDHEAIHGLQDVNGIRVLAREFAGRYSPDNKAIQPLYGVFFSTTCFLRNIRLPDDYNDDNYYDPDGLYPDDPDIKKKLKRLNKRAEIFANTLIEHMNQRE